MIKPSMARRVAAALISASLAVAGVTACGNDSPKQNGKRVVRVGFYAPAGGGSEQTMNKLAAQFNAAHPDVVLKLESAPYDQFFPRLRTQLAGGTAPDVWLSDGVLVQEFAQRGALRDLQPRLAGINPKDFLGLNIAQRGGHTYGFPQGMQTPVLFYNKKLFDKAKVGYPTADWTYDDLAAAAKKLTRDTNGDGKPDQWGFRAYSPGFTETWWPIIRAFGGQVVNDDASRVSLDNPGAKQAMHWMVDAMYRDRFAPDPATSKALGNPIQLFASGKVAMAYGIYARILAAKQAGLDFDVAPLPNGPAGRGNVAIVNQWVINKAAGDKVADAAWQWIRFFAGKEAQRAWAALGEAVPINAEVAASPDFRQGTDVPKNREVFVESASAAADLGVNAAWSEYTAAISDSLGDAFTRHADIDKALAAAQSGGQAAIDRAG